MDDRRRFEEYVEKVNALMRSEEFYANFRRRLRASRPELKLNKKDRKKHFELDWIEMIESCITNLDNIVRNPRKFIVVEEDIVDISLARAISTESIKHLAQHTNMIAAVDKEGNVTPNRILNTTKEESFEVYENRFIYTLLKNLSNFVSRRLDAIKMSYVNDHILELTAKANFYMGKTRVFYNLELSGSLPSDPEREAEQSRDIEILQRVTKLQRIISDFLSSPFAKQMVNSAPVRPPITRTNVILKNPDFKKALVLWQFIESYTKMGFQVENDVKKIPVDDKVETAVSDMMCFSNMIMEGLIQGEAQDAAFYDEANITEEDVKEKEVERRRKDRTRRYLPKRKRKSNSPRSRKSPSRCRSRRKLPKRAERREKRRVPRTRPKTRRGPKRKRARKRNFRRTSASPRSAICSSRRIPRSRRRNCAVSIWRSTGSCSPSAELRQNGRRTSRRYRAASRARRERICADSSKRKRRPWNACSPARKRWKKSSGRRRKDSACAPNGD